MVDEKSEKAKQEEEKRAHDEAVERDEARRRERTAQGKVHEQDAYPGEGNEPGKPSRPSNPEQSNQYPDQPDSPAQPDMSNPAPQPKLGEPFKPRPPTEGERRASDNLSKKPK